MFNRQYNLIFGMFLGEFVDKVETLYFKKPSSIYELDYKSIVENLWKTNISNNLGEDIKVKKLISNVNIGLLEKGTNKSQKSLVFDTLSEALYHQSLYGGRINKISGFYDDAELTEMTGEYIKELEQELKAGNEIGKWNMYGDSGYNLNGCIGHYRIKDGKYYNVEIVAKKKRKSNITQ